MTRFTYPVPPRILWSVIACPAVDPDDVAEGREICCVVHWQHFSTGLYTHYDFETLFYIVAKIYFGNSKSSNRSLETKQSNPAFLAAFCASYLVKNCNALAFNKHGRSMLASDMVQEIHQVFQDIFEHD